MRTNRYQTNILFPQNYIVSDHEALLARELHDAKIQSASNSRNSMHSSQPQVSHLESNDNFMKDSNAVTKRILENSNLLFNTLYFSC